jgi:alpha-tubulin suppressor-like RCC1 family protein
MDLMQKLAEEAAGITAPAPAPAPAEEEQKAAEKETVVAPANAGILLMAGCNDWDNAASKTAEGLDGPHMLDLGGLVSRCFSNSSSCFSFFLLTDGRLFAIGNNSHGQLGVGSNLGTHNTPCQVPTDKFTSPIAKITTGKHHTLLLLQNGDLFAAGSNTFGQCGLGAGARAAQDATEFSRLPVGGVTDIACGWDHSLLCNAEGQLYTFGKHCLPLILILILILIFLLLLYLSIFTSH